MRALQKHVVIKPLLSVIQLQLWLDAPAAPVLQFAQPAITLPLARTSTYTMENVKLHALQKHVVIKPLLCVIQLRLWLDAPAAPVLKFAQPAITLPLARASTYTMENVKLRALQKHVVIKPLLRVIQIQLWLDAPAALVLQFARPAINLPLAPTSTYTMENV